MEEKLWEEIIKDGLTYEQALEEGNEGFYFTRPEWLGFHFIDGDSKHTIVTKDKITLNVTEEEVTDKDAVDWMLVSITDEAVELVRLHQEEVITREIRKTLANDEFLKEVEK